MKKRTIPLILLFLPLVFLLKGAVSDVDPSPNWFRVDDPLTKFTTGHYTKRLLGPAEGDCLYVVYLKNGYMYLAKGYMDSYGQKSNSKRKPIRGIAMFTDEDVLLWTKHVPTFPRNLVPPDVDHIPAFHIELTVKDVSILEAAYPLTLMELDAKYGPFLDYGMNVPPWPVCILSDGRILQFHGVGYAEGKTDIWNGVLVEPYRIWDPHTMAWTVIAKKK